MISLKTKSKDANLGNVIRLKLIPVADVVRIKNYNRDGSTIVTDEHRLKGDCLILKTGYRIYDVAVPAGVANFSESDFDGLPGCGYRQDIASVLPGDSYDIAGQLRNFKDGEWLLIFEDAGGDVRLMGTKTTPVLMTHSFSTSGTKARSLMFSSVSKEPAYYLDAWANATIITTTDDGVESDYPV